MPQAIGRLILFQAFHHSAIAMQDAWTVFTIFGQTTQQLCHTGSHPAITSTPIERNIRCMIEKTIRTLQFIQIHHHFSGSTVYIFTITGNSISLSLYNRNHIHIVNPQTSLPGISFLIPFFFFGFCIFRKLPLSIGIRKTQIQITLIFCYLIQFQR